jgi:hypothetical protein
MQSVSDHLLVRSVREQLRTAVLKVRCGTQYFDLDLFANRIIEVREHGSVASLGERVTNLDDHILGRDHRGTQNPCPRHRTLVVLIVLSQECQKVGRIGEDCAHGFLGVP